MLVLNIAGHLIMVALSVSALLCAQPGGPYCGAFESLSCFHAKCICQRLRQQRLTFVSMAGTGWACASKTCTRTDALAVGKGHAAITVTVNVAAHAPSEVTDTVSASDDNSPAASASELTTIS